MTAAAHIAASLIDWTALAKILVAALIGGAGVVIAFGFVLLGLDRAKAAQRRHSRVAYRTVAGICGVGCVAAVAIGIYAMTQKPSPKPAHQPKSAALRTRGVRLAGGPAHPWSRVVLEPRDVLRTEFTGTYG